MTIEKIKDYLKRKWLRSKVRTNLQNSKLNDWYWALEHRLNPGHRYHIINTGLKPGYYDPEHRILHAVMEEVCSFFEDTCDELCWIDLEHGYDDSDTFYTLLEIYEYWQWRKQFTTHFGSDECDQYKNDSTPFMDEPREYWQCLDKLEQRDQEVSELDQRMLRRAIDIRHHLWYP